jgi:hypothetical protein
VTNHESISCGDECAQTLPAKSIFNSLLDEKGVPVSHIGNNLCYQLLSGYWSTRDFQEQPGPHTAVDEILNVYNDFDSYSNAIARAKVKLLCVAFRQENLRQNRPAYLRLIVNSAEVRT